MLHFIISLKKKIYLPILYSDATPYFLIRSNKREILKILIRNVTWPVIKSTNRGVRKCMKLKIC